MKFRDPKTGKVFDDICSARKTFCGMWCTSCPLIIAYGTKYGCESWVRKNEEKAARLMGYEVLFDDKEIANKKAHWIDNADSYICSACGHEVDNPNKQTCGAGQCMFCGAYMETKEDNMDKQNKPRLAEVLGVEVGELFKVEGVSVRLFISEDGMPKIYDGDSGLDVEGMSIYTAINHPESIIRAPRLTEPEIAIMRAVGAKWVSFDTNSIDEAVMLWSYKPDNDGNGDFSSPISILATVTADLFPSVKPGNCIGMEDAE